MKNAESGLIIDVVVKFGGSAITDKNTVETLKPEQLRICSERIRQCKDAGLTCVVVHGAGSYGHHQAKEFGVNKGMCELKTEEEKRKRMRGFTLTRQSVTKLNKLVVDSLIDFGVQAISCSPGIAWKTKQRQPVHWPSDGLQELLENGLVPVFHGDCCFDEDLGYCILSGDTIIKSICSHFAAKRVIFYTDVAGIYNKPPEDSGAQLLKTISVSKNDSKVTGIESTCAFHDVTGGINLKLQTAFDIVKTTSSIVYVCDAHSKDAGLVTLFLNEKDEDLKLTKIVCLS